MTYKLEPAFTVYPGLNRKLVLAGRDITNEWFFPEGGFYPDGIIEHQPNTYATEDFVVLDEEGIIAFFSGRWSRPLDVITGFRLILFEKSKAVCATKALFDYFDYLFVNRGCQAFNWIVAEQNTHAYELYEKFIDKYFGHRVGKRHCGQKSYSGKVSDVFLYEITKDEYFAWKNTK